MKLLLTAICVTGLNGAMLYPLMVLGAGRPLNLLVELVLFGVGSGSLYLLYRFRKSL